MAILTINDSTLTMLGDAIREKYGETSLYTVFQMAEKIAALGKAKISHGTFNPATTTSSISITHDLGVVPDFVMYWSLSKNVSSNNDISMSYGARRNAIFPNVWNSSGPLRRVACGGSERTWRTCPVITDTTYDITDSYSLDGMIHKASDTGFMIAASSSHTFDVTNGYFWFALGGV